MRIAKPVRIGCMGASGTGKTTIATWIAERFHLEMNPIGSRSVAKAMGYSSPYHVDADGKRAVFQRRLIEEKVVWESSRESFVTDRTTLDNLAYTVMHDPMVAVTDDDMVRRVVAGMKRYTDILIFPVEAFCKLEGDPIRVQSLQYHRLYEAVLHGLRETFTKDLRCTIHKMPAADIAERQKVVESIVSTRRFSPAIPF